MRLHQRVMIGVLVLSLELTATAQNISAPLVQVGRQGGDAGSSKELNPEVALFTAQAAPAPAQSFLPGRRTRSTRRTILFVTIFLVGFFLLALAAGRS